MRTTFRLRALIGAAATTLVLAVAGTPPALGSYGELAHFGESGTGKGQFNLAESFGGTEAIGVDTTTNAVYVVDGPTKKEYRLQKFELQGGSWKAVAEQKFKPGIPRLAGVEGVAVDHANNRVYLLVVQERGENVAADPEIQVAAALYAFSASTLAPASGTTEGLLAGAETLQPLSTTAGVSLLEPAGIAVDPTSGDVVLLGYQDASGDDEEPLVALERVKSNGALGARWTDSSDFFGAAGEALPEVSSPVVTPGGNVYVLGGELPIAEEPFDEIDEVPSDFTSKATPVAVVKFAAESLLTFPGEPSPLDGGGLAIGTDGTLYAYAQLLRQEGAGFHEPAVAEFAADGHELGWTGGQGQPKEGGHVPCAVSFRGHPVLAAGAEGKVFVFDNDPQSPDVVELGPGGSGCPTASSSPLAATVSNEPVTGPVAVGAKVRFASTLTQANALGETWEFINSSSKATETVVGPSGQAQSPELIHSFTAEGTYTVKETIKTDDLASPIIVVEATVKAQAAAPTAQFSATTPVTLGTAASFDAKSSAGNGAPITAYTWDFGDGSAPVTLTGSSTSHTYASSGSYTVTLTVKTSIGTATVSHAVEVVAPTGGGGGGGGGGGTTTPTVTTTTPHVSVLSYSASVAGRSLSVSRAGKLALKIACSGQSSCTGSVTLRTASAVAAGHGKSVLILASGSFSAAGASTKTVTLTLTAKARKLLAHVHVLKAKVTIVGKDAVGASHTSTAVVTLRASKSH